MALRELGGSSTLTLWGHNSPWLVPSWARVRNTILLVPGVMQASRTDSHSPNIRLRIIQTLQSSIFHCRGQTLITGENSLPYWAGHITAPDPQLVCRNAISGDRMRYQKASRSMCRGSNFPGSQESPMSADQNTLFNLSISLLNKTGSILPHSCSMENIFVPI